VAFGQPRLATVRPAAALLLQHLPLPLRPARSPDPSKIAGRMTQSRAL
jgi:hypothetical protein